MSIWLQNGHLAQSINKWEENTKWSITQSTDGVFLYKDLGGVSDNVDEQTLTLDGVSEHRNLCALVDV
jgi:hypothetical protein